MPNWSELVDRLPQIALAVLAAKRGGPLAAAAFNQGVQQRDGSRTDLARQAQMDEERRQAATQAQADRQRQLTLQEDQAARLAAGDTREAERETYARKLGAVNFLSGYAKDLGETATDPLQAEQAFQQQAVMREGLAGMEPGSLAALTPSFTAPMSARKAASIRRVASVKLKEIQDTFGDQAEAGTYEVEELATLLGDAYPGRLGVTDLQRYAGIQATGPTGEPLRMGQRPATAGASDLDRTYRRLRAAFVVQEQREPTAQEDVALDKQARDEARVVTPVDPSIAALREVNLELARQRLAEGPQTAANVKLRTQRIASALNSVEDLRKLAPERMRGPAGIVQGIGQTAAGYAGFNTRARQFTALVQPTAMQMAVAIQGAANLSDSERQVMAQSLGSMSMMDYESQMALLDRAVKMLVQSGAEVSQVGGVWHPTDQAPRTPAGTDLGATWGAP